MPAMRHKTVPLLLACFCLAKLYAQVRPYHELHRPQFHFSPPAHWMNDPNGLVFYQGEYHLCYQYYPDSTVWGPMHWGHAISTDLVHWKHLPIALYPDSLGYIFSGSSVVDQHNSSGLKKGPEAPLVATYTYHNITGEKTGRNDFQTQGMAYSVDKGRTWHKYTNNPVISNPGIKDFRDPKVAWHEAGRYWVLTMAAGDEVHFYRSADLKHWEFTGSFGKEEGMHGGVWECPDLFELKTKEGDSRWILLVSIGAGAANGGSGTQYFVGNFDGKTFHNEDTKKQSYWLDNGKDNYAGITWNNTTGRRLFIGWMSNWQYAETVPTKNWRSAMTLPRELYLQKTPTGYRLQTVPAKELTALRKTPPISIRSGKTYPFSLAEILLTFDLSGNTPEDMGIELSNGRNEKLRIGYNASGNQFYINRTQFNNTGFSKEFPGIHIAPRVLQNKKILLHLFLDTSSVELFADNGTVVMTDVFFPSEPFNTLQTFGQSPGIPIPEGKMYALKSIW